MLNAFDASILQRAHRAVRGFSLVEVTLAVAIVTIGMVGILALFPLGMDATRKAADDTQMMAIGQDLIASNQQLAVQINKYSTKISSTVPFCPEVIANGFYSYNTIMGGIYYLVDVTVTNAGFSQIFSYTNDYAFAGATNMTSRVQIAVYRTTPNHTRITNSLHYYFTEVTRYVQ